MVQGRIKKEAAFGYLFFIIDFHNLLEMPSYSKGKTTKNAV